MLAERKTRSSKGYSLGIVQASESGSLPKLNVVGEKECHKEKKNVWIRLKTFYSPITDTPITLIQREYSGNSHTAYKAK